ncbi:mechanosensitive ion channel family protein [Ilumatobacter nonamiensis]|uniref:mechanosensitive ion channel family protein n=1 Tax=Ilumatobacter nonamiensis TaxID=467093 RepID=UPI00034C7E8B|nr:mechanosensitive ion channel domain-containing protein [Ilumatobacter nonamiensis]
MMILRAEQDTETDTEAIARAFQPDEGLTAWDWGQAGITFLVAVILSRVLKWLVERTLRKRMDAALAVLIGRLVGYVVILIGVVYTFESLGLDVGVVLGALGIFGIALAFAFQDILQNFIAGILLQMKRPFTYGDQVEIDGHEGTIRAIDSRLVTIDTPDGETVMIPSATVIAADINNYTTLGGRRTSLEVGVAYGTDLALTREVLDGAVTSVDGVRDVPDPEVLFTGFGDSSIDFVVRYWHEPSIATFWRTRSEVGLAIDLALADAGITIPFPQRTLHWGTPPDAEPDDD